MPERTAEGVGGVSMAEQRKIYAQDVNIRLGLTRLNDPGKLMEVAKDSGLAHAVIIAKGLRNYPDYNTQSFLRSVVVEALGGRRG